MIWVLWFLMLIAQNGAFTLVSRARNSDNIAYHAWASLLSNGVWYLNQFILFASMAQILAERDWLMGFVTFLVYTGGTMTGSLGMHWLALNKIERRNKEKK